ncbi:hypothetical protein [Shewanella benthica]|nr:hypothetical protein [Shewanella benthica]
MHQTDTSIVTALAIKYVGATSHVSDRYFNRHGIGNQIHRG